MARLINQCIIATILIISILTFTSMLRQSTGGISSNTGINPHVGLDESLSGAVEQDAPKAQPPSYTPSNVRIPKKGGKDKHNPDEHKTDEHNPDEHKTDEHTTDEHKTEEHKTDEHKTDEHKTDEHKTDEHKTDEHGSENKPDEHKSEEKKPEPEPSKDEPKQEPTKTEDNKKLILEFKPFEVSENTVFDKGGPKPEQIVMLTGGDGRGNNGDIPNLIDKVNENRQQYADYHGYKFHFVDFSKFDLKGVHAVWAKIPAIIEAFNTYKDCQWIWWLDLDAIIMEPSVDLKTHLLSHSAMYDRLEKGVELGKGGGHLSGIFTSKEPDVNQIELLVSQDHNGLNAGSFLLRRSTFTNLLLDLWLDPFFVNNNWAGKEQDALLHLVLNHKFVRNRTGYVPQRAINAYPVGSGNMGWKTGDPVVHLAGCWVESKCAERWNDFWSRRTTVEDLKKKKQEEEKASQEQQQH